jgi:hypothetical protein
VQALLRAPFVFSVAIAVIACASVPAGQPTANGPCRLDDAACCDGLLERVRVAYEQRDDQTGDEQLADLMLGCPSHRGHALERWKREDAAREFGPGLVGLQFVYEAELGPGDQIVWTAAYFDRVRAQRLVSAGKHTLEVQARVLAGDGAAKGRVIELQRVEALDLQEGAAELRIRIASAGGAEPFHLETQLSPRAVTVGRGGGVSAGGTGGRSGRGGGAPEGARQAPPSPQPRPFVRKPAPDFRLASELLDGGAAPLQVMNFVDHDGRLARIDLRGRPHPRVLGAVLDWLRRFEYQLSDPDWPPNRLRGDGFEIKFDRASFPAPAQYP